MEQWDYFFQAQVGASAALVGLIFVSISISLTRILAAPPLPGRALHALRVEWGNCLDTLRGLEPSTVEGANEKLNAAQVFLTFSCEADGSAAELLALATRELDHVTANLRVSDRAQISRPRNIQGPRGWFERLTRRA